MIVDHDASDQQPLLLDRRCTLAGVATLLVSGFGGALAQPPLFETQRATLRKIEKRGLGRLGAYVFDTQSGTGFGLREDERFAHCSSFKMSLAAMVLHMADKGRADLREVLRWSAADMLMMSPVTEANIAHGLTVEALVKATLITSDNTAANVLLRRFGGPLALTAFWRSLGDNVSRVDRYEPEMNETPLGTQLDTTTPRAMAITTAALVHGRVLAPPSRAKLVNWLAQVRTGTQRIRAGFPKGWRSGDKTGTGMGRTKHTYVDLAYGGPAGRAPLIVTAYFEPTNLTERIAPASLKVLADVGRVAAQSLCAGGSDQLRMPAPCQPE
jgi:beta-lactamase class A